MWNFSHCISLGVCVWFGHRRTSSCQLEGGGGCSVTLGYQRGHLLFGTTLGYEWQHVCVWVCFYTSVMIWTAGRNEISGWWVIFILLPLSSLHISLFILSSPFYLLPLPFPPPSPDSREEAVLGSIPLPSYVISPVGPEDHISRKYAFKVRGFVFALDAPWCVDYQLLSLLWFCLETKILKVNVRTKKNKS